jgi:integrase
VGEVIRREKGGKFIGFYLRFYDADGRRRQIASQQPTQAEARKMLLQIEARIARGAAGIEERRTDWPTVAELIDRFTVEYQRPRIKDVEGYRAQRRSVLQRALPALGKLRTAHVTDADIVKLRDALSRRYAPGTVRNVLGVLSVVFSWAIKRGMAPHNPCCGVERPIAQQSLDFLSRQEVRRLLDAAAASSRLQHVAVSLAVHTGLRKGELFGLRWIDLDLDSRRLTVARSFNTTPKSGKPRHMRLPVELLPLLRQWRDECPPSPGGLVLPRGITASRMANPDAMCGLPRLLRQAGIHVMPRPWHALRHTFASHFVMCGGSILALSKILGHADVKVTMIYAHLAPDFLADEMDKVKF